MTYLTLTGLRSAAREYLLQHPGDDFARLMERRLAMGRPLTYRQTQVLEGLRAEDRRQLVEHIRAICDGA
jgi:hypothetical protein